jgi:hypothetical protein
MQMLAPRRHSSTHMLATVECAESRKEEREIDRKKYLPRERLLNSLKPIQLGK